ncbi:MAG TPA: (d)CMP kinase [Candidatus Binatia bacterium]|nr:(d)CMP kinase [Candidatus Binatia bacterium]
MITVVAVDGPAGAGKSTASRALAARLGFGYVDTGAMYRAVGVLAHEAGLALDDEAPLVTLLDGLHFGLEDGGTRLVVDGRDVSQAIRRGDAGELASKVSVNPGVRTRLVALQRALGIGGRVVMEGRDIGTVVFPDAPVKLYLTADPVERARRRASEMRGRGEAVDEARLAREIVERDRRDSERPTSPLRPATDAVLLDTTTIPFDAVVERMEAIARAALPAEALSGRASP